MSNELRRMPGARQAYSLGSRQGLRTPLANANRRREAEAVEDQGTSTGMSESEVLRETSSYNRVPGMRRAMQGPEDAPRIPNMVPTDYNMEGYVRQRRANGTPMKKGGPVKAASKAKRKKK